MIGQGGMGMVYLARHNASGALVAIKVLMENFAANTEIAERFRREAEMMAHLSHENIVKLISFNSGTQFNLIMEYIDGRGLDSMIGQEVGPIPYERAVPLFLQVLSALSYAHSEGVIHRDIKPANILVSNQNQIKVTDFGIAKIVGQKGLTKTGVKMGTLYYMSPEQIKGEKTDHRCDIYSLGMTLYEMLAGRLPFDDSEETSEYQIMNRIINRRKDPDPREYYPYIPDWLVGILQKAMAVDLRERFQSCDEFSENIVMCLSGYGDAIDYWSSLACPSDADEAVTIISEGNDEPIGDKYLSCPYCGRPVDSNADKCLHCDGALTNYCTGCGGLIPLNNKLCLECKDVESVSVRDIPVAGIERPVKKEFWFTLGFSLIALIFLCMIANDGIHLNAESVLVCISMIVLLFIVYRTTEYTLSISLMMLGITGAIFFSNFKYMLSTLEDVFIQSGNLWWIICMMLFTLNTASVHRPNRGGIRTGVVLLTILLLFLLIISFTVVEVWSKWENPDDLTVNDLIVFPGYIFIVIPLIQLLFKSKKIETNRKRSMGSQRGFLFGIYLLLFISRTEWLSNYRSYEMPFLIGLRDVAIPFAFLVIIGVGSVHFLLNVISPLNVSAGNG